MAGLVAYCGLVFVLCFFPRQEMTYTHILFEGSERMIERGEGKKKTIGRKRKKGPITTAQQQAAISDVWILLFVLVLFCCDHHLPSGRPGSSCSLFPVAIMALSHCSSSS
jgi:hypothetical protein